MNQKLLFLLFGLLLYIGAKAECTATILPGVGSYVTPATEGTYSDPHFYCFQAVEDCVLTIQTDNASSVQLAGRYECDAYNSFYATGASPKLVVQLQANQAFYFTYMYNSEGAIPFTISQRTGVTFGGSSCSSAITITETTQFIPYNNVNYQTGTYIIYTASQSGRLVLQHAELNSIEVYQNCDDYQPQSIYPDYNDGQKIKMMVEMGTSYLIKLSNSMPIDLTFEIQTVALGSSCDAPITAQIGSNGCKKERGTTWFEYKPSKDGYAEISLCGLEYPFDGTVKLYNGCGDYTPITATVCPDQTGGFYLRSKVLSSNTYLVNVDITFELDQDFQFQIAEFDPLAGDEFSTAIAVSSATPITIRSTNQGSHWYKFTATQDGYIEVSNCGSAGFSGYLNIRDSNDSYVYSSNICTSTEANTVKQRFTAAASETYYMEWNLNSGCESFDFTVTEHPILDGDNCNIPIVLTSSEMTLNSQIGDHWYQYTPNSTGWLLIHIKSTQWQDYSDRLVVKEGCLSIESDVRMVESGASGFIYKTSAIAGQPLMINLSTNNIYAQPISVELSESAYQLGDVCSLAIDKSIGTHSHPKTGETIWYRFTAPTTGFYQISTTLPSYYSTLKTKVGDCDATLNIVGSKPESYYTYEQVVGLAASENLYFEINPHQASIADYSFTISEKVILPGQMCSAAATLPIDGSTQTIASQDNASFWYTFTPSSEGKVLISSCGGSVFTAFQAYIGCETAPIAYSGSCPSYDGQQLTLNVQAGINYLIEFRNVQNATTFSATYSAFDQGDICSDPILLSEGTHNYACSENGVWYYYKASQAGTLTLSNCGSSFYGSWDLYSNCDTPSTIYSQNCSNYDGKSIELMMSADQEIWIKMFRSTLTTSTVVGFTPTTSLEQESALTTKLYPNPNQGCFEISHSEPALLRIYSTSGSLVYQQLLTQSGNSTINAQHLESGVYMVQIQGANLQKTTKLVIE